MPAINPFDFTVSGRATLRIFKIIEYEIRLCSSANVELYQIIMRLKNENWKIDKFKE